MKDKITHIIFYNVIYNIYDMNIKNQKIFIMIYDDFNCFFPTIWSYSYILSSSLNVRSFIHLYLLHWHRCHIWSIIYLFLIHYSMLLNVRSFFHFYSLYWYKYHIQSIIWSLIDCHSILFNIKSFFHFCSLY